jgi:hypothetical protein
LLPDPPPPTHTAPPPHKASSHRPTPCRHTLSCRCLHSLLFASNVTTSPPPDFAPLPVGQGEPASTSRTHVSRRPHNAAACATAHHSTAWTRHGSAEEVNEFTTTWPVWWLPWRSRCCVPVLFTRHVQVHFKMYGETRRCPAHACCCCCWRLFPLFTQICLTVQ